MVGASRHDIAGPQGRIQRRRRRNPANGAENVGAHPASGTRRASRQEIRLMSSNTLESSAPPDEAHWIPLSDLMTGLMAMFLLIAVTFMMHVEAEAFNVRQVAVAYSETKDALFADLQAEF